MAKSPTEKKAPDPTVVGKRGDVPEYPEGTHPPVPPEDQTWGPGRFNYSDMEASLKPDKSSNVQTVEDPLEEKQRKAQAVSAEEAEKARKASQD